VLAQIYNTDLKLFYRLVMLEGLVYLLQNRIFIDNMVIRKEKSILYFYKVGSLSVVLEVGHLLINLSLN
jgi:hypothetical protein